MPRIPFLPLLCLSILGAARADELDYLKPAAGYAVEYYAKDAPDARSLARSPKGTLFVGTREKNVYAFRDGKRATISDSLDTPNGIAFRNGNLYVAEVGRLLEFADIDAKLDAAFAKAAPSKSLALPYRTIYAKLPTETHHGWRYMAFAPEGSLYLAVGAPCNVCGRDDPRFASILRFAKLDGSAPEVYARGIRNSVGFDWHPRTGALWFTENGRDWMGDEIPSDELDVADKKGMNFGFPYCHQGDILDPEFGKKRACAEFTPPALKLGPHVAALGMRFLDENTILIAQHGSWNRTKAIGYRVMRVTLKDGKPDRYEPFLEGFLAPNGNVRGRPVDIEVLPDRSVVVSDDHGGHLYRVFPKR